MSTPASQPSSKRSKTSNALIAATATIIAALITTTGVIIVGLSNRPQSQSPSPALVMTPASPLPVPSVTSTVCASTEMLNATSWLVTRGCDLVHINYNTGTSFPEYASLDLKSGYFRMNYGLISNWGTSLLLLPAFWSHDTCLPDGYCQGAPVKIVDGQLRTEGTDLIVPLDGNIGKLHVLSVVHLLPPMNNALRAQVQTTLEGTVQLDKNRSNEAFKPITLASMYDSPKQWDAQQVFADKNQFGFPQNTGWILQSPVSAHTFGLQGGTSDWKKNAPTIEVVLTQPEKMNVTGWISQDNNPQDDNVTLWTTTETVLNAWSYTVTASS